MTFRFILSVLTHLNGALIFLSRTVSSVFDSLTFRLSSSSTSLTNVLNRIVPAFLLLLSLRHQRILFHVARVISYFIAT